MGKLDERVALVTGGARGQCRSHALAMAAEGGVVVVCDIAADLDVDTDLYGRRVGLEFARQLRGMVRFDDVDSLVEQMKEDAEQTRG
ncbi:MAG: hypothetical protein QOC73_2257, partial [Actinomycetota bacterium]|nr:hypothetical protein [Actinomycetota bacterium]